MIEFDRTIAGLQIQPQDRRVFLNAFVDTIAAAYATLVKEKGLSEFSSDLVPKELLKSIPGNTD